jgi:superfamily II DNA helicase RecQ
MIRNGSDDKYNPSIRRKVDQLYTCVQYCEDEFRCRRTMQLEFFGERFDRAKCNKTCDNCRAGKEPDKRDMTAEAITIINLFDSASNNKRGGVTILQLSELYRGSKTKAITKNYQVNRIKGFGAGSKFKKQDIDRIMHAMIFERIFVENSVENKGGFSSDYVGLGENSSSLQRGSRQFFVEFPQTKVAAKKAKPEKPKKKEPARKTNTRSTKSPTRGKPKKPPSSRATRTDATDIGGLHFTEIEVGDSEDDDDSILDGSKGGTHNSENIQTALSHHHTKKITDVLKMLVRRWADEEQMMGNNVHCKSFIRIENVCLLQTKVMKIL